MSNNLPSRHGTQCQLDERRQDVTARNGKYKHQEKMKGVCIGRKKGQKLHPETKRGSQGYMAGEATIFKIIFYKTQSTTGNTC